MPPLAEGYFRNYLVHGLSKDAVSMLAALATEEVFLGNEFIIREGERGSDLFIVLDGTVNIVIGGSDKLCDVGPGGVFGEIALLDDQPRSADVIARHKVKVAKIPAKALRDFMWDHKEIGFVLLVNMSRVLCTRLREASHKIDILTDASADPWAGQI